MKYKNEKMRAKNSNTVIKPISKQHPFDKQMAKIYFMIAIIIKIELF